MRDIEILKDSHKKENQLSIGIDLGTSWTAVMSDRGDRFLNRTIVGYPKDIIGRQVVGSNFVVGEDALQQKESLSLYFPMESGVVKDTTEKDITAATELLTYAVSLTKPRPEDEVCGIIGVPARASIISKELILRIAKDALHIATVVSEPFLVAYGLGTLRNTIIVDIGAGTIDVCGLKGMFPGEEDQITLITAGDYIDNFLLTAITERYPDVQLTKNLARRIKEEYSFVGPPSSPVMVTLRVGGKPRQFEVTQEIRAACESIVPDMVEAIQSIVQGFNPENQEDALKNIYLAGGGSRIKGLARMVAAGLKGYGEVGVNCVEDPIFAGCVGAIKLISDIPPKFWARLGTMIYFD
jgi:rod shape-determining protein MreB